MPRLATIPALLSLLLFLNVPWAANAPAERWSRLATTTFRHLSHNDGLPHPIVTAAAQDAQDFIWLGTQGGLARFDGYRLKVFAAGGSAGDLPGNFVLSLHLDPRQQLWVGLQNAGLAFFDPKTERFVRYASVRERDVWALNSDAGGLWIGSGNGLLRLEFGATEAVAVQIAPTHPAATHFAGRIHALWTDRSGWLWIGGEHGLSRWRSPGSAAIEHLAVVPGVKRVWTLAEDSAGRVWFGTESDGAGWIDADLKVHVALPGTAPELAGRRVTSIAAAADERIWIATYGGGVVEFTDGETRAIVHDAAAPASLASNAVRTLLRDRSGLLWVGGDGGVDRHDPTNPVFVNVLASAIIGNGPGDPNIVEVQRADEQRGEVQELLLGYGASGMGSLSIPDQGKASIAPLPFETPAETPPFDQQRVLSAAMAGEGELWAGTLKGLYKLNRNLRSAARLALPTPNPYPRIDALLAVDRQLWVGSDDGLVRLHSDSLKTDLFRQDPGAPDSLPNNRVNTLFRDRLGRLWVGHTGGLSRLTGQDRFVNYRFDVESPSGLCHNDVVSLNEDLRGRLWVATLGGGVCMLEDEAKGRFRRLDRHDGLPHDNIGALLSTADGMLWASTANGLARIDPERFTAQAFGAADGVATLNYWIDSATTTAAGELVFGGLGGFSVVRPQHWRDWTYAPRLAISSLRINGRWQSAPTPDAAGLMAPILVAPNPRAIEFEYAALDFSAPEKLRYQHRLEGLDPEWNESDATRRLASFGNLAPGEYRLRVRATNRAGVVSAHLIDLPIVVLPAWYQTTAFRAIVLLLALAMVFGVLQARTALLRKRQRELEQVVHLRTAELTTANARLRHSAQTLRHLADIGKDLATRLDSLGICHTLHRHLGGLLPLDAFGVALIEPAGAALRYLFYIEDGFVAEHVDALPLDHPTSLTVRAFREAREFEVLDEADAASAPDMAGIVPIEPMRSLVFHPLLLDRERIGVVTIQSHRGGAYGERELEVFRSVAAYAAIAFGNARAFTAIETAKAQAESAHTRAESWGREAASALEALRDAQGQLIQHEKMASLGELVAGVAHEVNTPIGVALTAGSHLSERTLAVKSALEHAQLQRSALHDFLSEAALSAQMIERNLNRAAQLIASFKQVSVDRTSDGRREFDLDVHLREVIESLAPSWKRRPLQLKIDCPPRLQLDSFPGALGQIVTNLIQNSLVHAFETEQPGNISIRASRADANHVELTLCDDGKGIDQANIDRIFDPFFTTRRNLGGTGLGLHIVFNLVAQKLGGHIDVRSEIGQGTTFTLRLPVRAPGCSSP